MASALFLTSRGVPVLLLERGTSPHADPRAATYHPPTLELLEPSGVTAELHDRGIVARTWQYRDRRLGLIAEFDLGALRDDTPYPYRLQCEQHKLVAMLERRVAASPLAEIQHGAEVQQVRQDDRGVEVTALMHGASLHRWRGSWLIGADGGRSVVRKSQDIAFDGFTWPERFLVITTSFDFEPLGFAFSSYTMDPHEWTATFKVPGEDGRGVWRSVFPTRSEQSEEELLDFDAARRRLQALVGAVERNQILNANIYAVHQRVAATYCRGRVLLVGDACHVNNPLGGMGLNFGIHDAHNLATKLAELWHGRAAADILQRYDRQRRTVAEDYLQSQTIANKQTLEERDEAKRLERQEQMRRTAADPALAHEFLLRTSMISTWRAAEAIG
jgi:3-(3-hydroxy-phenyl)propionate hydroxylase